MLHLGLDPSRRRLDVYVLSDEGELVEELAAPPDPEGLRYLVGKLARHGQPVRAVIESMTGARFVHDTLEQLGWDVLIADAQRVKGLARWRARPTRSMREGWRCSRTATQSWRRRAFRRSLSLAHTDPSSDPMEQRCPACAAAPAKPCQTPDRRVMKRSHVARQRPKVPGRPYDLRHSFASLLLHEGRSVIYVARQLGHDPRLTLSTYGHVIDGLEDVPRTTPRRRSPRLRVMLAGTEQPTRESRA